MEFLGGGTKIRDICGNEICLDYPEAGYGAFIHGSVVEHCVESSHGYLRATWTTSFFPAQTSLDNLDQAGLSHSLLLLIFTKIFLEIQESATV